MAKPFAMALASGFDRICREPSSDERRSGRNGRGVSVIASSRRALREQALTLRAGDLGYKRLATALGLTRDQARELVRPGSTCPDCGGLKCRKARRCLGCTTTNRQPTERRSQ